MRSPAASTERTRSGTAASAGSGGYTYAPLSAVEGIVRRRVRRVAVENRAGGSVVRAKVERNAVFLHRRDEERHDGNDGQNPEQRHGHQSSGARRPDRAHGRRHRCKRRRRHRDTDGSMRAGTAGARAHQHARDQRGDHECRHERLDPVPVPCARAHPEHYRQEPQEREARA